MEWRGCCQHTGISHHINLKHWVQIKMVAILQKIFVIYNVITRKHFPKNDINTTTKTRHYWPFKRAIHRPPMNSHLYSSNAKFWCFLWYLILVKLLKSVEKPVISDVMVLRWRHCHVVVCWNKPPLKPGQNGRHFHKHLLERESVFWFKYHWCFFFQWVQLTKVRIGPGNDLAPNSLQCNRPYQSQCWPSSLAHLCITSV